MTDHQENFTNGYVRVGPSRVRVRTTGSGEPLLLLMGIGGSIDMWQPLAAELPDRHLVMFDFPGTAESSLPWFPPTMAHSALFIRLLMRKLGLEQTDVLGYSWGGLLAQQLAAQHPRTVRKLVLACTGPGLLGFPGNPRTVARLLKPPQLRSPEHLAKFAAGTYGGKVRYHPSLLAPHVTPRIDHPARWAGYAFQLMAASTFSTIPIAPFIRCKTLILAGDDDPLLNIKNQHLLHRLLSRADLRIIEGAGHLVLLDSPEESALIVQSFLGACDSQ